MTVPAIILFDWDGTLVDSFGLLFAAHNHVRREMGLMPWTPEEARASIRASARESYPQIYGPDKAGAAMKILYAYIDENYPPAPAVMPGAFEALEAIAGLGIPMGVVSNKRHAYLVREIEALEWQGFFTSIVGAGRAARDKPAADPALMAVSEITGGTESELLSRIWLVGDTQTDILCAKAAACIPVFMRGGMGEDEIIGKNHPDHVFEDCRDLQVFLESALLSA